VLEVPPIAPAPVPVPGAPVVDETLDVAEDDEPPPTVVVLPLACPVPPTPLAAELVVPVVMPEVVVDGFKGMSMSWGSAPVPPTPFVSPSASGSPLHPSRSRASNAARSHAILRM